MSRANKLTTTKFIMGSSALLMAFAGLSLTFFPEELSSTLHFPGDTAGILMIQGIGAMYFGFAMLNWMSKSSLIGGVYNRPIAIANMTHFLMVGITLIKVMISNNDLPQAFWIVTAIYVVYAILLGWLLFRTPPVVKSS